MLVNALYCTDTEQSSYNEKVFFSLNNLKNFTMYNFNITFGAIFTKDSS